MATRPHSDTVGMFAIAIMNDGLVAEGRPVALAVTVTLPLPAMIRLENVARPFAPVTAVVVPLKVAAPLASTRLMDTPLVATLFPAVSSNWTSMLGAITLLD